MMAPFPAGFSALTTAQTRGWIDCNPPPSILAGQRFGYGPGEVDWAAEIAAAAAVSPQVTAEEARLFHIDFNNSDSVDRPFWREVAQDFRRNALRRRIVLALSAPSGVGERVFAFWADHFTTVSRSFQTIPMQVSMTDEAIRPHIGGRFAAMLKAVTLHPMMLMFLDQTTSAGDNSAYAKANPGTGLNENLGRELIELHTLGVDGPYTQEDVREAANLLAGAIYRIYSRGFVYDPSRAEPGVETILGRDYPADSVAEIERMLEDLAMHPATARHLSRKLATHFLTDTPSEALIGLMAAAYLDSNGALMPVYEVMAASLENRLPVRQKIRQPLEWMIASLRAVGITGPEIEALPPTLFETHIVKALATLGQPFEQAAGPDGWPEEERAWIAPQPLTQRLAWARTAPAAILDASARALPDPKEVISACFLNPCGPMVTWAPRSETRASAIAGILCSPEFLRR